MCAKKGESNIVNMNKVLNVVETVGGCCYTFEDFLNVRAKCPGGLSYETDRDARRKFRIIHFKKTNLDLAQTYFWPLKDTKMIK